LTRSSGGETLFNASQSLVEYRDEKIDGDKATLQVKDSAGSWETVPFVREGGVWKIDKLSEVNQFMKEPYENQRRAFPSEEGVEGTSDAGRFAVSGVKTCQLSSPFELCGPWRKMQSRYHVCPTTCL